MLIWFSSINIDKYLNSPFTTLLNFGVPDAKSLPGQLDKLYAEEKETVIVIVNV